VSAIGEIEVAVVSRRALFIVVIVVVALVGAGLLISPQSFAENLLAESVGVVVSVVIALALVERLLERERARQWQDVRALVLRAIWAHIADFAFECALTIPRLDAGVEDDYRLLSTHDFEMPTAESAAALERLRKRLQNEAMNLMAAPTSHRIVVRSEDTQELSGVVYRPDGVVIVPDEKTGDDVHGRYLDQASSRELYDAASPHLNPLRDVMTPRVLQSGRDLELVELLILVETAHRHWASALEMIDGWGAPETFGWEAVDEVVTSLVNLTRRLASIGTG
jgi:hypothetical protein